MAPRRPVGQDRRIALGASDQGQTDSDVEGKLQTRQWDDKDGNKRYTTESRGDRVVLLGRGAGGGGRQQQATAGPAGMDEPWASPRPSSTHDDIPFEIAVYRSRIHRDVASRIRRIHGTGRGLRINAWDADYADSQGTRRCTLEIRVIRAVPSNP